MQQHTFTKHLQQNHHLALLCIITSTALALMLVRIIGTQSLGLVFLTWNLFLAWVPLLWIKWISHLDSQIKRPLWVVTGSLVPWLLFFPNAPYLITDLMHLRSVPESMIWFDAVLLFSFALAGMLTGLYSIRIVFRLLHSRTNAFFIWTLVIFAMVLSGFGVFLGRFGRWNSWDIITQPDMLAKGILHSLTNPLALKHTGIFSFVLILLYFAFHILAELKSHESKHRYTKGHSQF